MSVFEYVSGYSTLFWCLRAKEVISVENDIKWYEKIKEKINEGGFNDKCSILFRENKDDYVKTISYYNKSFDVIVIYGNWRNLCAEEVALHIKKYGGGILIFDNSDWYPKTMQFLRDSLSWVEVDFHGFAPLNHNTLTTSIFINPNIRINYVKPLNSVCGIKGVTE
jgi:predicted O-methyltransferase YrrM